MNVLYLIYLYSSVFNVDPRLVSAIVNVESKFNPDARGQLGEVGLMQVMPSAASCSVSDLKDPATNIVQGIKLLKEAQTKCKNKPGLTWVVCYNMGPRKGARIKHPEKLTYYKQVLQEYNRNVKAKTLPYWQ